MASKRAMVRYAWLLSKGAWVTKWSRSIKGVEKQTVYACKEGHLPPRAVLLGGGGGGLSRKPRWKLCACPKRVTTPKGASLEKQKLGRCQTHKDIWWLVHGAQSPTNYRFSDTRSLISGNLINLIKFA